MGQPAPDRAPVTASQPPNPGAPSERSRNLACVFGAALRLGTVTRSELITATGLSKATVARMVDELTSLDLLTATPQAGEPQGRGRRPAALAVSGNLGQVIGVSFGVRRVVVLSTDLAGHELFHKTHDTPAWETLPEAVSWLESIIAQARDRSGTAPLRRVVVAVPARIVNGAEISHPPLSMSPLEGAAFAAALAHRLDTEVALDSDANTALTGLLAEGLIPEAESSVLLNMGTALTVSQRRVDGSTAQGRSSAFGDLSLIPFHTPAGDSTLGDLLSRHGLERYCVQRGVPPEELSRLLAAPDPSAAPASPEMSTIQAVFLEAVLMALRIIVVTIDPQLVILAGRLFPLVERILPELLRRVAEELDDPPRIQSAALHGTTHSTAHGAARIALTHVQRALCEQVGSGARPPVAG